MTATTLDQTYFHMLGEAVKQVMGNPQIAKTLTDEHVSRTPERVVAAFQEYFEGCFLDPADELKVGWEEKKYDQMIRTNRISFFSTCMHHWAPFFGKVHFAYVPDGRIVGLSKVPRYIDILARRPQIQEKLSEEIVSVFEDTVKPLGCGVVIEAYHLCVAARGVRCEQAYTTTTALRGCFKEETTKMEFLSLVPRGEVIWP